MAATPSIGAVPSSSPEVAHRTSNTFGGYPLVYAAELADLTALIEEDQSEDGARVGSPIDQIPSMEPPPGLASRRDTDRTQVK